MRSLLYLAYEAVREDQKDKAWEVWLSRYATMTKETFVPFEKFYQPIKKVDKQEDILESVSNILEMGVI